MNRFLNLFAPTASMSILDVGGYPSTWIDTGASAAITVLNIHPINYERHSGHPLIETVVGNGCELNFGDRQFDIVFSNSVIEHLGTSDKQKAFAEECRRVGNSYWVQTPARSFFVEPHLITPFIHFLPVKLQRKLLRNFTVWGWLTRPSTSDIDAFLAEIRLLSREEMEELFPEADIICEKFLGFTKSYVAVHVAHP